MPKRDGIECLREIRADHNTETLPVIILSASARPQSVDEAFTLGAFYFLQKSNSFKAMTTILEGLLVIDWKHQPPTPRDKFLIADTGEL
jgi:CheY-like chemotaxis protein